MNNGNVTSRAMSLGLFMLFIAALALSLVAAVRSYAVIVGVNDEVLSHRVANGAIANTLHSMDSFNAVTSKELDQGEALVIREVTDVGIFENRFYLWNGNVILEFAPASDPYDPSRGTTLVESSTFDFDIDGDLVTITTDEGTTVVAMQSSQEVISGE